MTVEYWAAPEVEAVAADLIDQHHRHLLECRVVFLHRYPTEERNGRVVLGKARKVGGVNAYLATFGVDGLPDDTEPVAPPVPFFLIEIAADEWRTADGPRRRALVDHELTHCVVGYNDDGDQVLKLRAHDLEDFVEIAERHGLWHPASRAYLGAVEKVEQLRIDWDTGRPGKAKAAAAVGTSATGGNVVPIKKTRGQKAGG